MAGRLGLVEVSAAVLLFSATALFGQNTPATPAPQPRAFRDSQRSHRILRLLPRRPKIRLLASSVFLFRTARIS
jgi:hypothetical protein